MKNLTTLLAENVHDQKLRSRVRPVDYRNPTPAEKYNLVVIGAGTAGLVTASVAAGLGAKVALIERSLMGGDCLTVGCVPSKGMISAARVVASTRDAVPFGVHVPNGVTVDFSAVMDRMRKLRSDISLADSVKRFTDKGIDVFLGQASFTDSRTVEVEGAKLNFAKAVIATGARALVPAIKGLETVDYLTNETVFNLTKRPPRLGVIGAGPIGAEMAQSFARFGSKVTLVTSHRGLMPKEDRDAVTVVHELMKREGVQFVKGGRDLVISEEKGGRVRMTYDHDRDGFDIVVDKLLVAAGRSPNVEGLGLETVNVKHSACGVEINDRFQTTNPRIYAAGDICSPHKFTHAADFMARSVVRNALFMGKAKHSALVIPRVTYTSPEIAQVGLTAEEAALRGIEIDTFDQPMAAVDRAILEGETEGFVRIHCRQGTDQIVGGTIVARNAGDMIGELSLAMTQGIGLGAIASTIHPYPTQGEAIRKVGDVYARTRLTPFVGKLIKTWLSWTR